MDWLILTLMISDISSLPNYVIAAMTMVDIARGLGDHITFLGLSVGGLMAAWVAQYRDDVNKAVIIAPSFTIGPRLGVGISRVIMRLFLILPNIMTQRLKPFKDGPDHNYLGFAPEGLGEMMRFGFSIYDLSKEEKCRGPIGTYHYECRRCCCEQ